jgi:unsaturated rhamnogalacturonyl hydrolase
MRLPKHLWHAVVIATLTLLLCSFALSGQSTKPADNPWVGDAPAVSLPFASDLSPALKRKDISRAMQKVADWQLARATEGFNRDWTFAALYAGFMAVPQAANGKKYQDAMLVLGRRLDWQPGPRLAHADDLAVGQAYLDLYSRHHDPVMIAPVKDRVDAVMQLPDDAQKPLWWWCDALFMAPPVLAKLSKATGERKYLDFMDHEWWITSGLL